MTTLSDLHKIHKETHLFGRYICADHLVPLLRSHQVITEIGRSVLGETIHAITIGTGQKKILMWSQMHGNESTTTKAIFDVLNTFKNSQSENLQFILQACTIAIIPILNPDGAKAYTRLNANGVDLNRDAQAQSQPESKALRLFFDSFKPHFCFNLHGQRTIFSAGNTRRPATISFLAPAQDEACTITDTRKQAMELIVKMNENLQQQIPGQVSIYDDAFNLNCVGDTFQSLNVPTVLFEAGHYNLDYDREVVREFIYQSLMISIEYIAANDVNGDNYKSYLDIPENRKLFFDIIIRNAKVKQQVMDIAVQYKETLVNEKVEFIPIVEKISDLKEYFGHKEVDAKQREVLTRDGLGIYAGYENDFVLLNNKKFSLKR